MKKQLEKVPFGGKYYILEYVDKLNRKHIAKISELGGALRSYKIDDFEIVAEFITEDGFPNVFSGIVLFPWVNRLRDGKYEYDGKEYTTPINEPSKHNQLHSFSQFYNFECVELTDSSITLGLRLPQTIDYKYDVYTEVTYKFEDNFLKIETESINLGSSKAPWSLGFHPWFNIRGNYEDAAIQINAKKVVKIDERSLPVEEVEVSGDLDRRGLGGFNKLNKSYDDAFFDFDKLDADVLLVGADKKVTKVYSSASLPVYQICTLASNATSGFQNTCAIEPCTSYADAFNNKRFLVELEPDSPFKTDWRIEFES